MSIRLRLALGMALLTLVSGLGVAGAQFMTLRSYLVTAERERLTLLLPQLERELRRPQSAPGAVQTIEQLPRTVDIRVLQGGQVVAETPDFPPISRTLPLGFAREAGHDVLVATVSRRGQVAQAQLASDVLGVVNPLRAYLHTLERVLPVAVLLAGALAYLLASRLLRPLRRLQAAALALSRGGRLRQPVPPLPMLGRSDELGQLAGVLQTAFEQVAEVRGREELFTQAAAHDLRSPLTAVKARLQGALGGPRSEGELREDIQEALHDVDRVRHLSDHLLRLAQGERAMQWLPVDLGELAGTLVDRQRERRPEWQLDFGAQGDTRMQGDPTLLGQLLDNLLHNAQHHAAGAPVQVSVSGSGAGVRLTVEDQGPGVPAAALPLLTQPFYRVEAARSAAGAGPGGNGLGLAIAQRIAQAHGAELSAQPASAATGAGLRVSVVFAPRPDLRASPDL